MGSARRVDNVTSEIFMHLITEKFCTWFQVKRYKKYVLFLKYLKLIVNCSCVQKENTEQKEIIHLVDPGTLQSKAAETICRILESKNMSVISIGNSVFDEINNV